MNRIKVRMELQLEAGDLVISQTAVAEALEAHAAQLRAQSFGATEIVDVPRGQLAFSVEVTPHG